MTEMKMREMNGPRSRKLARLHNAEETVCLG